ncbi:MAG: metabolite traffic protein EboE [Planctomycetaceae bacterium]|nr:metabolite traffic protein EboE [Planctomycetaceae bacterium]
MTFSRLPLSYCTNVHPGRTVAEVIDGLNHYTAEVRRQLDEPLAAGLWLSRSVTTELLQDRSNLESLAQTLWQNDLTCYTLNAFPFGDFHTDRVKEQVYLPDWASTDRLAYTKDCATLLAELLPAGSEGSISTVPLGGSMNPMEPDFHAACFRNLLQMARFLRDLEKSTGRKIRLAIEPEPMCEMSSIPHQAVPMMRTFLELADAHGQLECAQEYIGLCVDVCHQAVEFEDLSASIDLVTKAGIRINKIHITNAVELRHPAQNAEAREALLNYVEPRYLHQIYAKMTDGSIQKRVDLTAEDLQNSDDEFRQAEAWRIHFHVPVFATELGPLNTTRTDLQAALGAVLRLPYAPHLEVETYTWPVMPGTGRNSSLPELICREIQSALELLAECESD